MQSVIGRLDDSVMRMIVDSVDEASKSRLSDGANGSSEASKPRLSGESRKGNMAIDKVKKYFDSFGMADQVKEFDVSSATVELAAKAVGCEPERIAKTLSFKVDDQPILIVCAGDAKIANPKYKAEFGQKAKMLTPDEAVELIGHAVGGVCPFGIKEGVDVYLDESLRRFDIIYPACGNGNSMVELTPEELEKLSDSRGWIGVCNY